MGSPDASLDRIVRIQRRAASQSKHSRLIGQTEARVRSGDVANKLPVTGSVAVAFLSAVRIFFAEQLVLDIHLLRRQQLAGIRMTGFVGM